jgi:hypothetical protein
MKNKISTLIKSAALGMLLATTACNDYLELEPIGVTSTDILFDDVRSVISVVNSAYAALGERGVTNPSSVYNGPIWDLDIASDDAGAGGGETALDNLTYDAAVGTALTYWQGCYKGIYRCNVVLERLPTAVFSGGTDALRKQLLAEVRYLRALHYFNLVRAFGDVPIILEEVKDIDKIQIARSPSAQVYATVESDLQEAVAGLPVRYTGGSLLGQEVGRATQGAAKALLAKVYLYQKKYADAARLAKEVIDGGVYRLVTDYNTNFKGQGENNAESIFEVQYAEQGVAGTFSSRISDNNSITAYPTDNQNISSLNAPIKTGGLVQAFEMGDTRRNLITNGDRKQTNGLPERLVNTKYFYVQAGGGNTNSPVNWPLMRFAEVLLIFAEAENEANGPTAAAYDALNRIRRRAFNVTNNSRDIATGLSKDAFREAVYAEQRRELWGEGHRWFELARTGRFVSVMSAHLGIAVQPQYSILPIPASELVRNPALTQTAGW